MATATAPITVPNLRQTSDFWDLSKRSLQAQRAGRYVPDQKDDPGYLKAGRTWPDVAGAIIDTYSKPGDLVFAPMCGTGVELVEAVWRGRSAMGIELEEDRAFRAIENLGLSPSEFANQSPIWSGVRAHVSNGDARQALGRWEFWRHLWDRQPRLVFIDPPFGETRQDGGKNRFGSVLHNYSGEDRIKGRNQRDQSNIGNLKLADQMAAMQQVFAQSLQVAADGAYMAVLSKDYRKQFSRIVLMAHLERAANAAGWRTFDRAVIYLGRAGHQQQRNAKANGNLLPITQDLLVFRKGR